MGDEQNRAGISFRLKTVCLKICAKQVQFSRLPNWAPLHGALWKLISKGSSLSRVVVLSTGQLESLSARCSAWCQGCCAPCSGLFAVKAAMNDVLCCAFAVVMFGSCCIDTGLSLITRAILCYAILHYTELYSSLGSAIVLPHCTAIIVIVDRWGHYEQRQ